MKRISTIFLFFLVNLMLFPVMTTSQDWTDHFINAENPNFYKIQRSFYDYWQDKDSLQKGNGWKQFKRWEWFWETRINEDGSFPSPQLVWDAIKKSESAKKDGSTKIQSTNNWTSLGPYDSEGGYSGLGRVNVVKQHPTNTNIIYLGTATGGLWYTNNLGVNWTPMTDYLSTLGITDIEFDPSNPSIMYLATGDAYQNKAYSIGVLKSTDGGYNWNETGLKFNISNLAVLARVRLQPGSSDVVFAVGSSGVYKSTNAGNVWTRVLSGSFKDMEFHPTDPNTIYVSGSQIYRTTDGGDNWQQLTNGIPTTGINRIAIAVAPSGSSTVYALCSKSQNSTFQGFYRSTNAGSSWTLMADTPNILGGSLNGSDTRGQGWYDLCITVAPNDKNRVFIGGINIWMTTNGGTDWTIKTNWYNNQVVPTVHADHHDLYFPPNSNILYNTNDGGLYRSTDLGTTWTWLGAGLRITQFYKFSTSASDPWKIIAGSQDNGTKLLSNTTWTDELGGDGMECIIDPVNSDIMYGSLYYGAISKSTNSGLSWKKINDKNNDGKYDDITENGGWVTPYVLDPNDRNTLFVGMNNLWKSTDGGSNFTKITNFSTTSDLDVIAISKSNSNFIYLTESNEIYRTTDGGATWSSVTGPTSRFITDLLIHPTNPEKIWITYSHFNSNQRVFHSTDSGVNWEDISSGLPSVPANAIIYQNESNDRLFVGTDIGVYFKDVSMTDWEEYNTGLPKVIITELEIQETTKKLRACTYGRGIWEKSLDLVLESPTLIFPANNAINLDIKSILFRWNTVNGATAYDFQLSTKSDFSNLDASRTGLNDTSFVVNNLIYNKRYYWRVRSSAGNPKSSWSDTFSFTTKLQPPDLTSPANGLTNLPVVVKFVWQPVAGAVSYNFEIAEDAGFSNIFIQETQIAGTERIINNFNYNTLYYWRVSAVNHDGISDWSEIFNFKTKLAIPVLLSPADNEQGLEINTNLTWSPVSGAENYSVQISENDNFSMMTEASIVTGTTYSPTKLSLATKYFWRVKALNPDSESDWSGINNFVTEISKPVPIFPQDNSFKNDYTLDFEWLPVTGSEGYMIQAATDQAFNGLILNKTTSGITFPVSGLTAAATYFWRVKAYKGTDTTEWSNVLKFTTKLESVTILNPIDGEKGIDEDYNFGWTAVSGATFYEIQVATDNAFTRDTATYISNNPTTVLDDILPCTKYYLRVRALNENNYSDWSEVISFSTEIGAPVLLSPKDTGNVPLSGMLIWKKLDCANIYDMQLAVDPSFSTPVANGTNIHVNQYEYSELEYNKSYFWRVRAKNAGLLSEWSETAVFFTKLETPVLFTPQAGEETMVDGILVWSDVQGAEEFLVQVSEQNDFSTLLYNSSTATSEFSYSKLPGNTFFWRVKALNANTESDWSETGSFKVIVIKSVRAVHEAPFEVAVIPHPVSDNSVIELAAEVDGAYDIALYNMQGSKIISIFSGYLIKGKNDIPLATDKLPSGIYFIKITHDNNAYGMPVVIKR